MLRSVRNVFIKIFSRRKDYGEPVFIQDPESGGYSAHYERYPETIAQGDTKKEALKCLHEMLEIVLKLEAEEAAEMSKARKKDGAKRDDKRLQHA